MSDPAGDQFSWETGRIEALGGAMIAAASAAGIGFSVVAMGPPAPRVVFISEKGVEILGHPREVILSRPATDFLTPDERVRRQDAPPPKDDHARFFETTALRSDGKHVPIEVSLSPIRLDGLPGLIAFMRDISERRKAVTALEQSERRFRQLVELAPDAVWINDGRRLVFANPAAAAMLRYDSIEALLAMDPRNLVAPEDQVSMRERTKLMFETGKPLAPKEYRTRRSDGSWVMTEVQSMPIEWEGAQALLGVARDVTERKEIEARLVRSERLVALGTLLAGIAHEMNNPLSYTLLGIEQAVSMLGQSIAPADGLADLREVLDRAHHGATRVAAVINQIRASSRPDVEDLGPVDLRAVLETALRVTQNEIHHRARLVTNLADVPKIVGSAQRLEQVFLNLLVNAVHALPDGRAENEITVVMRAGAADEVIVEVTDNGEGIPKDILSRIFDPFFTTKPVGLGLGLGLSICHGIVTAHRGTISVESTPTLGSTFRIVLPAGAPAVEDAHAPSRQRATGTAPSTNRRRRVLVVDDEPALGTIIRRVLEKDCDVEVVVDPRVALAKLAKDDTYDLVLCDLMMPNMTGMDLYKAVAQRHPGLEQRFVFMTGGAFTPRAAEFLAEVKNLRLEKPFESAVLRAVVAQQD